MSQNRAAVQFPLGRERFGGKVTDIHLRPWLASLRDLRLLCDKQKPAGETSGVIRRRKGWVIVESIYQNDRRCAASVPRSFNQNTGSKPEQRHHN